MRLSDSPGRSRPLVGKAAEALIDSRVPADSADTGSTTPLALAVLDAQLAAAELLLMKDADANLVPAAGIQLLTIGRASSRFSRARPPTRAARHYWPETEDHAHARRESEGEHQGAGAAAGPGRAGQRLRH